LLAGGEKSVEERCDHGAPQQLRRVRRAWAARLEEGHEEGIKGDRR
jgi:hypothetical protein